MIQNESFWVHRNDEWTLASFLIRALSWSISDKFISYEEFFYIIDSLGVKKRFSEYWDVSGFYQELGLPDVAIGKVDRSRDGWRTEQGNIAWSSGDIEKAITYYRNSIKYGDSTLSGWGGLFRIAFSKADYKQCVEIFLNVCPPRNYYDGVGLIDVLYPSDVVKKDHEYCVFKKKFKGKSPYFISTSKTMAKSVIFSFLATNSLNANVISMISDYFHLSHHQIRELSTSIDHNEMELKRILKYLLPKPNKTKITLQQVLTNGNTERANSIKQKILDCQGIVREMVRVLGVFLASGNKSSLDEMFEPRLVIGDKQMDSYLFEAALEFVVDDAVDMPEHQLYLLRTFGLFTSYPSSGISSGAEGKWTRQQICYFSEFKKIAACLKIKPDPIDLIVGMKRINWYKRDDEFDYALTRKDAEWSMAVLLEFIEQNYSEGVLETKNAYEEFLREAYLFLERKYKEAQCEQRWKSEGLLFTAISSLFGNDSVQQHASPIWLSPQHLDIYLPQIKLAIEYMGKQHYEPVEWFGGTEAFDATVKRDQYKKMLCARMGVDLVYVTHEEDVGLRAQEIFEVYGRKPCQFMCR